MIHIKQVPNRCWKPLDLQVVQVLDSTRPGMQDQGCLHQLPSQPEYSSAMLLAWGNGVHNTIKLVVSVEAS
jgi:hypothetical protein